MIRFPLTLLAALVVCILVVMPAGSNAVSALLAGLVVCILGAKLDVSAGY